MIEAPGLHHVIIVGAGTRGRVARATLAAAGVSDVVVIDSAADPALEVLAAVFDDDTDSWGLTTAGGDVARGRVVIAAHRPPYVPWIPDLPGRNDFGGESFHAAAWNPAFEAAGKRIVAVGTDAAVARHLDRLVDSAASVTVVAQPPRRVVCDLPLMTTRARRWLRRRLRGGQPRRSAALAGSAIAALTPSGVHTHDGVEYGADAIIYGTGFAIPDQLPERALVGARGVTLRQAWHDGMEPFLGIAVHGFPNYFFISGPDNADVTAQTRYAVECLDLMNRTGSSRIEVLRSSQQVFNERAQLQPVRAQRVSGAFDLSASAPGDDTYDGAATLDLGGARLPVRVHLTGHLDPIDGNYHWQGTVLDPLPQAPLSRSRTATLTVGERSAPARIVEQTPWGTHSVAGVGAPPYPSSVR